MNTKSLWNDEEAAAYKTPLAQRVYTSRLLGRAPDLVLHGGGNTSVKISQNNLFGEQEEVLYIKGSGWDLETIEECGFAPVRLLPVRRLAQLAALSDPQMVNELRTQLLRDKAPTPSVETILHAILPYTFVDHTHSDAVVTITNTINGRERIAEIYGDEVVIIPYVMPGFDLARLCAGEFPRQCKSNTIGMVLLNHGIFSFGETARESYERMIALVNKAEAYLQKKNAWFLSEPTISLSGAASQRLDIAQLRKDLSDTAGFPMVLTTYRDAQVFDFIRRGEAISKKGPATPDHVIRTKPLPLWGRDVKSYSEAYRAYFERNVPLAKEPKTMLDPAPRVILDPVLGLCAAGKSPKDTNIIIDIYKHTIDVITRAEALGGCVPLPEKDLFDVEYWDLEQAKLKGGGKAPVFGGEIVCITGAASGIGKACADSFLARGAAVIGLDIQPSIESQYDRNDYLGLVCDVTDAQARVWALEQGVRHFGGLDMLILNAGIFPGGRRLEALGDEEWSRVMRLNVDANVGLLRDAHPLLKRAPKGGRVVIVGSKNVPAPGPGAAAYSASKAALNQVARVAALEWGADKIRINSVHPNAVFDTALWTEEVLASRAAHYHLSVEQYKRNNILGVEIKSRDVAELIAEMCGPLFSKTTGAQVPIDGGNERVI